MIETYLKEDIVNGVKVYKTYTRIENLTLDPQNPRDISDEKLSDLKEFLTKYPSLKPLLVDIRPEKEGQLIGGNQRLKAYQKLGVSEVWIEPRDPITDAQAFEMGTIDNMEFGHYIESKLTEALKQFEGQIDFNKLGVNLSEVPTFSQVLQRLNSGTVEDEPPAVSNEPAISIPGTVYQLGKHRLMCGDATDLENVTKLTNGASIDMVFTDPPYNVDYEGKTADALKIENDKFGSTEEFYNFLLLSFENMAAVSKSGASIYVCHADSEGLNFRKAFIEAGWLLKQCIIWNKNTLVMGRQDYHWKHEPILYGWKDGGSHTFYGDRTQTTVWNIDRPTSSQEHPTMKPIALIANALKNSSKGGDIILDLFGGSGSTLIACEQMDRVCHTMELDPRYVDVIRKRYAKFINAENWEEVTPAIDVSNTTPGVDPANLQPEQQQETA